MLGLSDAVHALLAAGAGADLARFDGADALLMATRRCHASVVQALLAAGAEPRPRASRPPTRIAERPVDKASVIASVAAAWGHSAHGTTPLSNALQLGSAEALRALLDAGVGSDADVSVALRESPPELRCLGALGAVCSSTVGAAGCASLLLKHPLTAGSATIALNARDMRGRTSMWHAAAKGHGALVLELLASDAAVDIASASGCLPVEALEAAVTASKSRNKLPERAAAAAEALAAVRERTSATALAAAAGVRAQASTARRSCSSKGAVSEPPDDDAEASDGESGQLRDGISKSSLAEDAVASAHSTKEAQVSFIDSFVARSAQPAECIPLETLALMRRVMPAMLGSLARDHSSGVDRHTAIERAFAGVNFAGLYQEAAQARRV